MTTGHILPEDVTRWFITSKIGDSTMIQQTLKKKECMAIILNHDKGQKNKGSSTE